MSSEEHEPEDLKPGDTVSMNVRYRPGAEEYEKQIADLITENSELRADLEEAYKLNATRYQDGYDAAAGPEAAARIKRLEQLWEGAKASNREFRATNQKLTAEVSEYSNALLNLSQQEDAKE